jgi:tRNA (mo5U34)-methyltransferase
MALDEAVREARKGLDRAKEYQEKGWYHSFKLPDGAIIRGAMSLEHQLQRYAAFPLPADLRGKRVLDIGAWDGWFSFEAERHGAAVTAVDYVEFPSFLEIRSKLASQVDYRVLDVYQLPQAGLGRFDVVFFLGVLYHVKHPLLALEIVCGLATDTVIVDSFVTDGDTWKDHRDDIPTMEFYETDELGNGLDNWVGPTVGCLLALCRAAGFARVELLQASGFNAVAACYRKWEPEPDAAGPEPPEVLDVLNALTFGLNFSTQKDEFISCWFRTPQASVARRDLRLEVDGFGVPALFARRDERGVWVANFRLPPGLTSGWKDVRLRFAGTRFGKTFRIAVDMPLQVERLVLHGVCDGVTWSLGEARAANGGFVSSWVTGLPDNCDRGNVHATASGRRLRVEYIGAPDAEGRRQINAALPPDLPRGKHPFRVECGGVTSESLTLNVV